MAGRSFSDYFRFQRAIFAAIVSVFVIRLVMSWAGFPNSYTRWVSINLVLVIGLLTGSFLDFRVFDAAIAKIEI